MRILPLARISFTTLLIAACGTNVTVFNAGAGGDASSSNSGVGGNSDVVGVGGSGTSMAGPGGNGSGGLGGGECNDASDCRTDSECIVADCQEGICVFEPLPAGEPCSANGDKVCDGLGECKSANGTPCTDSGECLNNFCVDGVCCDGGCDNLCEACNISGNEGACMPHAVGTDPDDECMPGVCDDTKACVSGDHIDSVSYGAGDFQVARGVAVDGADNVIVVGYFFDSVNFGSGSLTSAGSRDVYIAKFDPTGTLLWALSYGDAGSDRAYDVDIDSSNNIFVSGRFNGNIDLGGGTLTGAGGQDVFVAKYDPSGNHLWSKSFGDAGNQFVQSVSVSPSGDVAIGGYFQSGIDFGGGLLLSNGSWDAFAAAFDGATGNHLWSARYGDAADQRIYAVAYDGGGNLVTTGRHMGSIDFGGGALTSAGDRDVFVAKLDGNGQHVWSKGYGDSDFQLAWNLAVDASGHIAVVGEFYGSIDFGGGALTSAGSNDIFVSMLDSAGNTLWSKSFGDGDNDQTAFDVSFDSNGHVVVVGNADGTVDFGGGPIGGGMGINALAFAAKFTFAGTHLWSHMWGTASWTTPYGVATTSSNEVYMVGTHGAAVDFGGGALGSTDYDAFVVKLQP
jgi:hypothetical protein